MRIVKLIALVAIVVAASGCRRGGDGVVSRIMANVSGSSGEVLLVMDQHLINGPEGERIIEIFRTPVDGLPQTEPMFNILSVTPSGFGSLYRNHRNIVRVHIDPQLTEPQLTIQTDVYAATQVMIRVAGPEINSLIDELDRRKNDVFSRILSAERERWISYYRRTQSTSNFHKMRDEHQIIMPVPAGYRIDVSEEGFVWIAQETPMTTQAVLIHYFDPGSSYAFTRESMIYLRDQLTRREVPGPTRGTYMGIEHRFPPMYRVFEHNGRNYAELRGLWTLVNGFMGGPFITLMTYDEKNNRAVMLDGFVYAPNDNKRDLLRQVEALLYTIDFYTPDTE